MTGQIVHQPAASHPCEPGTPSPELPTGTVWRCDQCGDEWTLIPSLALDVDPKPCPEWWVRDLPDPGIADGGARWYDWAMVAVLVVAGFVAALVFG